MWRLLRRYDSALFHDFDKCMKCVVYVVVVVVVAYSIHDGGGAGGAIHRDDTNVHDVLRYYDECHRPPNNDVGTH